MKARSTVEAALSEPVKCALGILELVTSYVTTRQKHIHESSTSSVVLFRYVEEEPGVHEEVAHQYRVYIILHVAILL